MFRLIVLSAIVGILSGCSSFFPKQQQDIPMSEISPAPHCSGDEECSQMWSNALRFLQIETGMRLQTVTDTFAQTYNATTMGYQSGEIIKVKTKNGYRIDANFYCDDNCGNLPNTSQDLFNKAVMHASGM